MFTSVDKALVSAVGAIAYIGNNFGWFHISPEVMTGIAGLAPILVYFIPNKKPAV